MGFRLGMVTGLATGYYLGTKAGRQRYDQINRSLLRLKDSDALEAAAERAKAVVADGVDKARAVVGSRTGHGDDHRFGGEVMSNGYGPGTPES